jgi:hypothetical protein
MNGWTDNYLRVSAYADRSLWNQITPVRLTNLQGEIFYGQVV